MRNLSYKAIGINSNINICIFTILFIKTIISVMDNSKHMEMSILDIFNTHYVAPILYKVTLVIFLYFISLNIEFFYNHNVFLRHKGRDTWFEEIIKYNYMLSALFSIFIFISSLIIYFVYKSELIGIDELFVIIIKTGFNFIYFSIFSIIYSIFRIITNNPIISIICEVFTYLIINDIIYNFILKDILESLFFINIITINDLKNFIISLIIIEIIIFIGKYIALKKNM